MSLGECTPEEVRQWADGPGHEEALAENARRDHHAWLVQRSALLDRVEEMLDDCIIDGEMLSCVRCGRAQPATTGRSGRRHDKDCEYATLKRDIAATKQGGAEEGK